MALICMHDCINSFKITPGGGPVDGPECLQQISHKGRLKYILDLLWAGAERWRRLFGWNWNPDLWTRSKADRALLTHQEKGYRRLLLPLAPSLLLLRLLLLLHLTLLPTVQIDKSPPPAADLCTETKWNLEYKQRSGRSWQACLIFVSAVWHWVSRSCDFG